ncbi:Tudor domain-containing protein 7A [Argiope bruennichi]|uniref:Tudor domain-containing protein 7A n=1 Tax=Argiope bruennichi TaxID=94029 RepID=A0A8T0FQ10_ARGBR|nr:Tudor domain-containing protein 7A [Argiope bruennichi]
MVCNQYLISLTRDYKDLLGTPIPFRELGYNSLEAFIQDIPDVISLKRNREGLFMAEGVADAATAHIASLVSRQKQAKPSVVSYENHSKNSVPTSKSPLLPSPKANSAFSRLDRPVRKNEIAPRFIRLNQRRMEAAATRKYSPPRTPPDRYSPSPRASPKGWISPRPSAIDDESYNQYNGNRIQNTPRPLLSRNNFGRLDRFKQQLENANSLASLPETPISNAGEIQILLSRIEEPNGMFINGIVREYENKFNESLPNGWMDILRQSSVVIMEEVAVKFGKVPDGTNFIVKVNKNSSGSTTPSEASADFYNMSKAMSAFYDSQTLPVQVVYERHLYAAVGECINDELVMHRVLVNRVFDNDIQSCQGDIRLEPGKMYAAKYPVDGKWYRAQVSNSTSIVTDPQMVIIEGDSKSLPKVSLHKRIYNKEDSFIISINETLASRLDASVTEPVAAAKVPTQLNLHHNVGSHLSKGSSMSDFVPRVATPVEESLINSIRKTSVSTPSNENLPCQAIKATLSGVLPKEMDWRAEHCIQFKNMVTEKMFVAIVQNKDLIDESDSSVKVELILIDTSTPDKDIYIHELLIEKEMARPAPIK